MSIEKIISKLEDAESAGVGGLQRDRLETAFNLIAFEYLQAMDACGNNPADSAINLIEGINCQLEKFNS